jgi:hypothetical protein
MTVTHRRAAGDVVVGRVTTCWRVADMPECAAEVRAPSVGWCRPVVVGEE